MLRTGNSSEGTRTRGDEVFASRLSMVVAAALTVGLLALLALAGPAHASTFTVTNTKSDGGPGSLRQAIEDANDVSDPDTINITATGTINLQSALPTLSTDMEINGPGADRLTVNLDPGGNVFGVSSSTVTISGLTAAGGQYGVRNLDPFDSGRKLTLKDVAVSDNSAAGIRNDGEIEIANSTIDSNGDGILNEPGRTLTLTNSTVSGNSGLGIRNNEGNITITNSTLTLNNAGNLANDRHGIGNRQRHKRQLGQWHGYQLRRRYPRRLRFDPDAD